MLPLFIDINFELLWGNAEVLFVKAEKVGVIIKAHGKAGLANGLLLPDQIIKQIQPTGNKIVIGRNTHIIPEQVGDIVFGKMEFVCQNV